MQNKMFILIILLSLSCLKNEVTSINNKTIDVAVEYSMSFEQYFTFSTELSKLVTTNRSAEILNDFKKQASHYAALIDREPPTSWKENFLYLSVDPENRNLYFYLIFDKNSVINLNYKDLNFIAKVIENYMTPVPKVPFAIPSE